MTDAIVPDTLQSDHYSVVQMMGQDTFMLPQIIIFPWPSREHFKTEFLAMDVTPELQERAARNVANESLAALRKSPDAVAFSGREGQFLPPPAGQKPLLLHRSDAANEHFQPARMGQIIQVLEGRRF